MALIIQQYSGQITEIFVYKFPPEIHQISHCNHAPLHVVIAKYNGVIEDKVGRGPGLEVLPPRWVRCVREYKETIETKNTRDRGFRSNLRGSELDKEI